MAKREIVLRLSMEDAKKRSKALQTAVAMDGIISAKLDGDKIVVIGEEIDSIELVTKLRNRMGFVELVSVKPVVESKEKKVDVVNKEAENIPPEFWWHLYQNQYQYSHPYPYEYVYKMREPSNDPCSIM